MCFSTTIAYKNLYKLMEGHVIILDSWLEVSGYSRKSCKYIKKTLVLLEEHGPAFRRTLSLSLFFYIYVYMMYVSSHV